MLRYCFHAGPDESQPKGYFVKIDCEPQQPWENTEVCRVFKTLPDQGVEPLLTKHRNEDCFNVGRKIQQRTLRVRVRNREKNPLWVLFLNARLDHENKSHVFLPFTKIMNKFKKQKSTDLMFLQYSFLFPCLSLSLFLPSPHSCSSSHLSIPSFFLPPAPGCFPVVPYPHSTSCPFVSRSLHNASLLLCRLWVFPCMKKTGIISLTVDGWPNLFLWTVSINRLSATVFSIYPHFCLPGLWNDTFVCNWSTLKCNSVSVD